MPRYFGVKTESNEFTKKKNCFVILINFIILFLVHFKGKVILKEELLF